MSRDFDRRTLTKTIIVGGITTTLVLPSRWTKPVVEAIVAPAHAQASPPATTSAPAPAPTSSTTTTSTTTGTTPLAPPTAE